MQLKATNSDFKPMSLMSLCLSFISLSIVSFLLFSKAEPETKHVFRGLDTLICCLFLLQICIDFFRSPNKKEFLKVHWIDILASIPMIEALRFARIFQVLRLLMVIRASHYFLSQYLTNRKEATIATILTLMVLLMTIGSSLVLVVEGKNPDANITDAADALWWAFVTISTVGYGDYYPVTFVGRLIAGVMILAGVGIFGMISGLVASMLATPEKENKSVQKIEQAQQDIKADIEEDEQRDKLLLAEIKKMQASQEQLLTEQQQLLTKVKDLEHQVNELKHK